MKRSNDKFRKDVKVSASTLDLLRHHKIELKFKSYDDLIDYLLFETVSRKQYERNQEAIEKHLNLINKMRDEMMSLVSALKQNKIEPALFMEQSQLENMSVYLKSIFKHYKIDHVINDFHKS